MRDRDRDRGRNVFLIASLAAAGLAVALSMSGTEAAAHGARIAALGSALALWLGEIGPRGPSALLLLVFVDLLGLAGTSSLFSGFAQPSFFFLVSVLGISASIAAVGTTTRVAQRLLRGDGRSALALLWQLPAFMLASAAVVSSGTARVSLLQPVLDDLAESPGANAGMNKFLTLFVANLNPLTSRAFLSGGPGIVVAADLMSRAGHDLGWGTWALWMGVPVASILALSAVAHVTWLRPPAMGGVTVRRDPFTRHDRIVGAVVVSMVVLWIFGPAVGIGAAAAALLGFAALAWLPQGVRILRGMDWDLVLFAGATLSFAGILLETGTAAWLGTLLFEPVASIETPYLGTLAIFGALVALRLPLSNGVSYSAMVFPVILSFGDIGGIASLHIAFMGLVAGGLVFLPIQSNPTMISYSRGRFGRRDSIVSGVLTFLAAFAVFQWLAIPYWTWLSR